MGSSMLTLTDETFATAVEKDASPILVDFWAEWCMPCKALTPVLEELATEFSGKIRFAKMNVDECRDVPARFGIKSIPTLLLFSQGQKVNELIGNQPKDKIRSALNQAGA